MATVYRAHDRKLDRAVAVKILSPDLSPLLGADRFAREIQFAASLQHPNIVALYDSGNEDGEFYYVMPLVEGETLRDRLKRETQLPLPDAIRIARDVLDALGYAHAQGVVHRDIKPENILLTAEKAVVADFGIAKAIGEAGGERITSSGLAVGTPTYMSPEQAGGKSAVDGRTDLYALACVLYEMLGGEPPFTGPTPQAILARQMQEAPRSLRVVRPAVPPALQDVVERGLVKVPADRFADAAAFAAALEHAERAPGSTVRRGRTVARLTAAILLVVAGTVAAWRWWPGPPPADPNRVMGFPLRVSGVTDAELGLQVLEAVGAELIHTEPVRWVSAWSLMSAEARGDPAGLTSHEARRLALRGRARFYVTGSVTATGDSSQVVLELYDAVADSFVAREQAAGRMPPPMLAFRAVAGLLPRVVGPSRHVAPSYLAARRPAAVALWLQGEVAYRHARYDSAMGLYERALAEDSGMAVAALKGAMAATWLHREREQAAGRISRGPALLSAALARVNELPARNASFTRGLAAFSAGHGDSALSLFRAALASDPDWSEALYAVGDVYYHLLTDDADSDSLATDAFERSVRLDPGFAPAIFHLAELRLRDGDRIGGGRLVADFDRISGDDARRAQLRAMLACLRDEPDAADWRALARHYPSSAATAARHFAAGMRRPTCAVPAFRAVLEADSTPRNWRWVAMQGLDYLLLARGESRRALAFADSLVATGHREAQALLLLGATVGAVPRDRADAVLRPYVAPVDSLRGVLLEFFGALYLSRDDPARHDSLRRVYVGLSESEAGARAWAHAFAARIALARADTATAIAELRQARPVLDGSDAAWGMFEPMARERLLLAQLLAATGRAQEALRIGDSFDRAALVNLVFLAPSLELRAGAARTLSLTTRARGYEARLRALRQPPTTE